MGTTKKSIKVQNGESHFNIFWGSRPNLKWTEFFNYDT